MIYAYDELYLKNAQYVFGNMLDWAVYCARVNLEDFYEKFLCSEIASSFEQGVPKVIAGSSGEELARDILHDYSTGVDDSSHTGDGRSPEFWTGYSVAYYQWFTAMQFSRIEQIADIASIRDMYHPYHEMDIRQFVDRMEELRHRRDLVTRLKYYRTKLGMSQSELARICDIPLKTIQNYEQRQKDINKAQFDYILRLSRALHCRAEDLVD